MFSQRRNFLDNLLLGQSPLMKGDIIDIGGEKNFIRGKFRPPLDQVNSWKYVNFDEKTNPDFLCSAEAIPLNNESIDGFLMCELLEHAANPETILKEAYRLLKPNGTGWISIPFLYQKHGDPDDFQRWTDLKIYKVMDNTGFKNIKIINMGSLGSVLFDLIFSTFMRYPKQDAIFKKILFRVFRYSRFIFKLIDKITFSFASEYINTGYFIIVKK